MDIKDNLAKNLIRYRKGLNLTQADVAEKLNYSDKTVSKWERGESIPDLIVLKQLADLYHVKIDTLIDTPKQPRPKINININKKRALIACALVSIVWIVAILGYVFIDMIYPTTNSWLSFIYASFITSVVLLVLAIIWNKNSLLATFITMVIWSAILSVYLGLKYNLASPPDKLWKIFLIGIPFQAATISWVLYRVIKNKDFKFIKKS